MTSPKVENAHKRDNENSQDASTNSHCVSTKDSAVQNPFENPDLVPIMNLVQTIQQEQSKKQNDNEIEGSSSRTVYRYCREPPEHLPMVDEHLNSSVVIACVVATNGIVQQMPPRLMISSDQFCFCTVVFYKIANQINDFLFEQELNHAWQSTLYCLVSTINIAPSSHCLYCLVSTINVAPSSQCVEQPLTAANAHGNGMEVLINQQMGIPTIKILFYVFVNNDVNHGHDAFANCQSKKMVMQIVELLCFAQYPVSAILKPDATPGDLNQNLVYNNNDAELIVVDGLNNPLIAMIVHHTKNKAELDPGE